jgi:hypothetical protein
MSPDPHSISLAAGAGVFVASKMIDSVAKMLPSGQEKRGDKKLEKARELAEAYKPMISRCDLDIIAERISQ